jgi:hypothetical protein
MAHPHRPVAQIEFVGKFFRLQGDQLSLVPQESVCFFAVGARNRQGDSDRVDARAKTFGGGFYPCRFFRHPGPHSLLFQAIETDGNLAGNGGAFLGEMTRYFMFLGSRDPPRGARLINDRGKN